MQAFLTVEKRKQLRHIVTEMQRTADSLISEAIDMLDDKYPAQPGRREGRAATRARPELKKEPPMGRSGLRLPRRRKIQSEVCPMRRWHGYRFQPE